MKGLRKFFVLFCAVLLLASSFGILSSAKVSEGVDAYEWKISEDETEISNGQRTYYKTSLPVGYRRSFTETYWFVNGGDLKGNGRDGEYLVFQSRANARRIYATEEGLAALQEFLAGEDYHYVRLANVYGSGYVDEMDVDLAYLESLDSLIGSARSTTMSVSMLDDALYLSLYVYDRYDSVCYTYGGIYYLGGTYWYINYDRLPNNFFDSEGEFSYRRGEVELFQLDDSMVAVLEKFDEESANRLNKDVFESNELPKISYFNKAQARFWIVYAHPMLLLPAVFTAVSFVKARKKGCGGERSWYLVGGLGALWLILGIAVLVILV